MMLALMCACLHLSQVVSCFNFTIPTVLLFLCQISLFSEHTFNRSSFETIVQAEFGTEVPPKCAARSW